jgi:hypothetical protein
VRIGTSPCKQRRLRLLLFITRTLFLQKLLQEDFLLSKKFFLAWREVHLWLLKVFLLLQCA